VVGAALLQLALGWAAVLTVPSALGEWARTLAGG
jgi:hypothetical protein